MKLYKILKLPGREVLATVACAKIVSHDHHYELRSQNHNEIMATLRITDKYLIEEVGGKN